MAAIGEAGGPQTRQYLSLKRLTKLELPHHPAFEKTIASDHSTSLVQFFDSLFTEVQHIDFDQGFKDHGQWKPRDGTVTMPPLVSSRDTIAVPVSVDKRTKSMNNANWLARRSTHSDTHVKFGELGELLCHDHSRNEAVYTPSVYDANELLSWDEEELLKALRQSSDKDKITNVEMSSRSNPEQY
jgi:hypothetical protein